MSAGTGRTAFWSTAAAAAVAHGDESSEVAARWGASSGIAPVLEALQAMASLAPGGKPCLPPLESDWLGQLEQAELSVYSQNGEDGVLLGILLNIGTTARYYVEFGTEDGSQVQTYDSDLGLPAQVCSGHAPHDVEKSALTSPPTSLRYLHPAVQHAHAARAAWLAWRADGWFV